MSEDKMEVDKEYSSDETEENIGSDVSNEDEEESGEESGEESEEEPPIHQAIDNYFYIKKGSFAAIEALLKQDNSVINEKNWDRDTPLRRAIEEGDYRLSQLFFSYHPNIEESGGWLSLLEAAFCKYESEKEIVELILENCNEKKVLLKEFLSDIDVELLIVNGNIDGLKFCYKHGLNILEGIDDGEFSDLPLNIAINESQYDVANYFLTIGAKVEEKDRNDFDAIEKLNRDGNNSKIQKLGSEREAMVEVLERYQFFQSQEQYFNENFQNSKYQEDITEFYKRYYQVGILSFEERKKSLENLTNIQKKIEKFIIISGQTLKFYLYVAQLKKESIDAGLSSSTINSPPTTTAAPISMTTNTHTNTSMAAELDSPGIDETVFDCIRSRKDGSVMVALPSEACTYAYLEEPQAGFYQLPDGKDKITKIFQLITSLLYENMRHEWDSLACVIIRNLIQKLDPKFEILDNCIEDLKTDTKKIPQKGGKKYFELALRLQESNEDFFGENVSDDSDSEEEKNFQASSTLHKSMLNAQARRMVFFTGTDRLVYQQTTASHEKGKLKFCKDKNIDRKEIFDKSNLQKVNHIRYLEGQIDEQVHQDLRRINYFLSHGELNEKTMAQIKTQFLVAQYRGVTYGTDVWNQSARRLHRKTSEVGSPLYSWSVYEKAGLLFTKPVNRYSQEEQEKLQVFALKLQDQLLLLRSSGNAKLNLTKTKSSSSYLYENAAIAIQDRYSKNIKDLHELIKTKLKSFKKGKVVAAMDDAIFLSFFNDKNAFISTGDVPFHALKYAYGIKFYANEKHKRLRPRYRKTGQPERPYSGKVYVSLHSPLDYEVGGVLHVPSLNETGRTQIDEKVVAELESTFPAFINKDKVVAQHIAKFPSFSKAYKEIYLYKYGLTSDIYLLFQNAIKESMPHSAEAKSVKNLLTLYLCTYHEICLIEQAKLAAENKNAILVYRDEFGSFSLYPAEVRPDSKADSGKAIFGNRAELRAKNRLGHAAEGFMSELMKNYQITSSSGQNHELNDIIRYLLLREGADMEVFNAFQENFDKNIQYPECGLISSFLKEKIYDYDATQLLCLADFLKVNFVIHSPRFENKVFRVQSASSASKDIHLYHAGGSAYFYLEPKINHEEMEVDFSEKTDKKFSGLTSS